MKKKTPTELAQHALRERLIAYYEERKKLGGQVQKDMAAEVPCAVDTMNAYLTRSRPIRSMSAVAIENYLDRMEG